MSHWTPTLEHSDQPLYQALADAIIADIERGALTAGEQLPTHRALADALDVTVGTVTRGYAVAKRLGWLEAAVGRGTFVTEERRKQPALAITEEVVDGGEEHIELGLNHPLNLSEPQLTDTLRKIVADPDAAARVDTLLRYSPAPGALRHRDAGARWLGRCGVDVEPSQVLITAGAQHALTTVFTALTQPGDTILAEALTYPGLIGLARLLDRKLHPVAIDEEGVVPESLEAACAQTRARLLYCVPDLHSPTTGTMSGERRDAIVEVARRNGLTLIEDAIHTPLIATPLPALAARAPERTVYIASLSKVIAGGLRVAYVAAPPGLTPALERAIAMTIWMVPPLMAEIATRWIDDGTAEATVTRKREETHRRQARATAMLAHLPHQTDQDSYNIWLHLPEPWRSSSFVEAARHKGISLTPTEAFVVGRAATPFSVRLSLCAPESMALLEEGLARLIALLKEESWAIGAI